MRLILTFILLSLTISALPQSGNNAFPPLRPPLQLTSNFAEYRKNHFHSGLDFSIYNKADKNVFSVWDGYVSRVRYNSASYGRAVYITHPNGYSSVYGHLDAFAPFIDSLVLKYQYENKTFETDIQIPAGTVPVKKGQVLGIAGNSGYSFGAHLHFEIRDAATDDPVNALKFIPVDDLLAPVFAQLAVYQLQSGGFLPAKATYYKAVKKGNLYTTATEIIVPDTFFLGFDVQDFQSFSYYRLLPQTIEVLLNDNLVWKIEFDRFAFSETGSCRGLFDHTAGLNNKKQIVTTYTGNHLKLRFYKNCTQNGLFSLPDTSKYKLTVKATDTEFNTSVFATTIQKKTTPAPERNKYLVAAHYFHTISTEHVTISVDTGTFYSDLAMKTPLIEEFNQNGVLWWQIGYTEIPILKPIHVHFGPDLITDDKTLLVLKEGNSIEKVWKPMPDAEGKLSADIDRPGRYQLLRDTLPPVISKTNIPTTGKLTWQKEITLTVTDNSGTFSGYNAYINNEWVLMTYDLKYNLFSIALSNAQKAAIKTLKVEFTDLAGNVLRKEFVFN